MCPALRARITRILDPFEVFERELPHLVGIDSKGNLVRKIEFMEREKEEMRNLTRASEIADGVFVSLFSNSVLWLF